MTTTEKTARSRTWGVLQGTRPPTVPEQRTICLECAAARTLHRVALLRLPVLPPPLQEQLRAMKRRVSAPVPVRRLVPLALELCKADHRGRSCEASMRWLEAEAKRDPRLAEALPTVRASLRRWHKAREIVVERNLRLAGSVVMRRFSHLPMSQDDMLQEAVFGLSHAADRFDPNYGVKFSTYATWWIRHAVQRAMQNTLRLVRIPAHLCDRIARYASAIGELGDRADVSEIATKIGEPVESTRKLAALYRTRAAPAMSLDEPAKTRPSHASDRGDPASARIDLLPAETPDLDEEISHEELARAVRVMIRDLPERSRKILAMRFGLDGEPATLERVGAHFGLTRERIRQIEKMAIRALSAKVPRALCTTSRV